jgi:hypothetical protein
MEKQHFYRDDLAGPLQGMRVLEATTQRTAQRISSGAVCRHLKIAGRVACFTIVSGYQPSTPNLQHIPLQLRQGWAV